MHLTAASLAHFLMGRGLLAASEVVAGNVTILNSSRRNRNFKMIRNGAAGLFVKQMREMQADAMLTLKREAACYELARDDPALSRLMPRLIAMMQPGMFLSSSSCRMRKVSPTIMPAKRHFLPTSANYWARGWVFITRTPARCSKARSCRRCSLAKCRSY